MNLCEKTIAACIAADCKKPIYTGIDSIGWIFNRSEIDLVATEATRTSADPNVYTEIVMATYPVNQGTEQEPDLVDVSYIGYKVQQFGKQPFAGTQVEMTEGNAMNKFTNTISFIVSDNSPAASELLNNLANGKFVLVLNNDYEGSDSRGHYQVFGMQKGLTASAITCEKYSEDTDGGWQITLTEENVPSSSLFIEHKTTNVVDTKSYLDSITDDCEPEE